MGMVPFDEDLLTSFPLQYVERLGFGRILRESGTHTLRMRPKSSKLRSTRNFMARK
jgi:hypothetical protein